MPLMKRGEADAAASTAREMRRTAELLNALVRVKPNARQKARARAHPEMKRIASRFAAVNKTLAKGIKAGSLTRAQLRSMGSNFAAIGRELQK